MFGRPWAEFGAGPRLAGGAGLCGAGAGLEAPGAAGGDAGFLLLDWLKARQEIISKASVIDSFPRMLLAAIFELIGPSSMPGRFLCDLRTRTINKMARKTLTPAGMIALLTELLCSLAGSKWGETRNGTSGAAQFHTHGRTAANIQAELKSYPGGSVAGRTALAHTFSPAKIRALRGRSDVARHRHALPHIKGNRNQGFEVAIAALS